MGKQVTNGQSIVSTEVKIREYYLDTVTKDTTYTDDTRTLKVSETNYFYEGIKLVKIEITTFANDGTTIQLIETINYFSDNGAVTKLIEKGS